MGCYKETKLRNRRVRFVCFWLCVIVALYILFTKSIGVFIDTVIGFVALILVLHLDWHWIERRELEIEWLKLKIEYLQNPDNFLANHPSGLLDYSLYLADCYEKDSELIADIKNEIYDAIPNDRLSKFVHNDWANKWILGMHK